MRLQHYLIIPVNQVFNLFRSFCLTNCDVHKEISDFIAVERTQVREITC